MPQGVVKSVVPILTRPCSGTVEALENDAKMGIEKGKRYPFKGEGGKCCEEGSLVEILRLNKDGTVKLDCTKEMEEQYESDGST